MNISAIALAGGEGLRARPLTLNSHDYLRSKAAMPLAGRSLIEWAVAALRTQGVKDFYVAAKGRENRAQIKALLEHGDRLGVSVRYLRPRFDAGNTGSGSATLGCLEYWGMRGTALVFPTDSVFEFDLAEMERAHRASGAMVTVATVSRTPGQAAGKYGVLVRGRGGFVSGFLEKPGFATAARVAVDGAVETNAGMYMIDCRRLLTAAEEPALRALAGRNLDWGHDLLPYLVAAGHPVTAHPIAKFGDLGSPRDYLVTVREMLRDEYPVFTAQAVLPALTGEETVRIHESTLAAADPETGRTLAERIAEGTVRIGPNVRIGQDVEIGRDVEIVDSDIADGVDVGDGARLHRVACQDHAMIGAGARLTDVFVGASSEIRSTWAAPVILDGFTAIGDEVRVHEGVRLRGVNVFPRLDVWADADIPAGASLTSAEDLWRWRREVDPVGGGH